MTQPCLMLRVSEFPQNIFQFLLPIKISEQPYYDFGFPNIYLSVKGSAIFNFCGKHRKEELAFKSWDQR